MPIKKITKIRKVLKTVEVDETYEEDVLVGPCHVAVYWSLDGRYRFNTYGGDQPLVVKADAYDPVTWGPRPYSTAFVIYVPDGVEPRTILDRMNGK